MASPIARSMTGFAQKTFETDGFNIVITIKSINGKGLDISFKAPPEMLSLEPFVKELIKSHVKRGAVYVYIDLKQNLISQINLEYMRNIIKDLKEFVSNLDINITDDKMLDLALNVYSKSEPLQESSIDKIKKYIEETLKDFILSKEKEGLFLIEDIKKRIELLEVYLDKATLDFKSYETKSKEKLIQKAKELMLTESNQTLVSELMLLLGRLDISEELSRIRNHINHLKEIINSKEIEKGKKIEFLSQELHREITTMSNKVPELSDISINMKYETDKIKQQCANLE